MLPKVAMCHIIMFWFWCGAIINSHNVPLYNSTAVYHDTQDVPLYHVLWEWHDTICVMVLNNHHIHSVFTWYRLLQIISKMLKNTWVYNDTK